MNEGRNDEPLLRAPDGTPVGEEEIRDLLADEGYSADRRKGWLKEVLTALTAEEKRGSSPRRRALIAEISQIIGDSRREPISD